MARWMGRIPSSELVRAPQRSTVLRSTVCLFNDCIHVTHSMSETGRLIDDKIERDEDLPVPGDYFWAGVSTPMPAGLWPAHMNVFMNK